MNNIIRFTTSYEYLSRKVAAYAPHGGAVLWQHEGKARLTGHDGTVSPEVCHELSSSKRITETVADLSAPIEAVYGPGWVRLPPTLSPGFCHYRLLLAIRNEMSLRSRRGRKNRT